MRQQVGIRCVFMRGGTSRGCYILDQDLPVDKEERDRLILRIYGSPDTRQIDGMGGSDALTSKIAIIKRSIRPDTDVEYTFGQVGIDSDKVSYGGNCGNMLSGVGPFAIDQGLVSVLEPLTTVRIYNTNTGQIIHAEVEVADGNACVSGDCAISGVPGTGSPIRLNFLGCQGSVTGKLFPTGNVRDTISLDIGDVEVSLVDAATPFVFVEAVSIGMSGDELPEQMLANASLMKRLEDIRGWAARVVGVVKDNENPTTVAPNVPRVSVVAPPKTYSTISGGEISGSDVALLGRQMSMQKPHKTYAVTGGICTAVAAKVPGTVVHRVAHITGETLKIGHPSGTIEVLATVQQTEEGAYLVERAALVRTARKIMEGYVYVPTDSLHSVPSV